LLASPLPSAHLPAKLPLPPTAPQSYREYQNARWHFSVFIPDDVVADEYDARGGQTIQFIDPQGNNQFQVSAWPYKDLTVHRDGIELATPSADNDQPEQLGTINVVQDDMFEFLFSKNGIRYVVQSVPNNATSTLDILKSWKFI
jgi:hypothetical protein